MRNCPDIGRRWLVKSGLVRALGVPGVKATSGHREAITQLSSTELCAKQRESAFPSTMSSGPHHYLASLWGHGGGQIVALVVKGISELRLRGLEVDRMLPFLGGSPDGLTRECPYGKWGPG